MSDDRFNRLQKKQEELARRINEKVSGDVREIQANISQSLKRNRESLRNYYIQLMEEEQTQAENDMNSGNTVGAMTHKMQADMYSFMLRSL
ncbi:MAG: hypothetical protein WAM88_07355 [Nitrososphaeraceae archaeon]|jgi:uncharacterized protein YdcH (DUF465 family)